MTASLHALIQLREIYAYPDASGVFGDFHHSCTPGSLGVNARDHLHSLHAVEVFLYPR